MVFHDRPVYQEEHAAQLIMARRLNSPPKAEYICADLSIALRFSLAVVRRTIHFRAVPHGAVTAVDEAIWIRNDEHGGWRCRCSIEDKRRQLWGMDSTSRTECFLRRWP